MSESNCGSSQLYLDEYDEKTIQNFPTAFGPWCCGLNAYIHIIRVDLVDGRRPNEKELATIFSKLVRYQDRTSISFYLPGMEVGTGAFATALLDRNASDPTLEVRINQ